MNHIREMNHRGTPAQAIWFPNSIQATLLAVLGFQNMCHVMQHTEGSVLDREVRRPIQDTLHRHLHITLTLE